MQETDYQHSKCRRVGERVAVHWITGEDQHEHSATGVVQWKDHNHIYVALDVAVLSPDPNQLPFTPGHVIAVPHTGVCWHPHPRVEPLEA